MSTKTLQLSSAQLALLNEALTAHYGNSVAAATGADRIRRESLLSQAREIEHLLRLVSSALPKSSGHQAAAGTENPSHAP